MSSRRLFLIATLSAAALPAFAQMTIEGVTFEGTAQVANTELVLNGVGVRAVAWLKGYAAALYLPAKANTPDAVQAASGAKRLRMRMLQEAPAAEFVKAIDKGITRNTAPDRLGALTERMKTFDNQVQAVGKVKKGDVVDLDFVPGQGFVFIMNGKPRGAPIAGDDFYDAVLRIFIGDKPVDEKLKAGLLGRPVA
jgi:hypothetical protein